MDTKREFLGYDASGRVRWFYFEQTSEEVCQAANAGVGLIVMVVPEPEVPAALVELFIKTTMGYDPGPFVDDQDAMQCSVVNN